GRRAPGQERAPAGRPAWGGPAAGWRHRVDSTHAEGYATVAGAIAWHGGIWHPRPRALAPYEPGSGRNPGFPHALVCPSVVEGLKLERLPDVGGLSACDAPCA